jgi:hypothetical protein
MAGVDPSVPEDWEDPKEPKQPDGRSTFSKVFWTCFIVGYILVFVFVVTWNALWPR